MNDCNVKYMAGTEIVITVTDYNNVDYNRDDCQIEWINEGYEMS